MDVEDRLLCLGIFQSQDVLPVRTVSVCGILCAFSDGQLVTVVAPGLVVNGCEQRGRRPVGGACPQPRQKAAPQETVLESQSGNLKSWISLRGDQLIFRSDWV